MKNLIGLVLFFGSTLLSGMELDKTKLTEKLISAVKKGSKEECKALIKSGAEVNPDVELYGRTALIMAAERGHKEVCELLISKGADVNVKDYSSETVLMVAAREGHKEICEILIANGADVNACWYSHGETVLMVAARMGHKEICTILIDNGAHINACDADENTVLTWAAHDGRKELCKFLIAHGADLNVRNSHGNTALMEAAKEGRKDVCELLLINMVLRGNSKVTIKEAQAKLSTVHRVLGKELPKDAELEIIALFKDDLSIFVAGCESMDRVSQILLEVIADTTARFLLSDEGKKLLEETQKVATDTVKDLFTIDGVVTVFPDKFGELLLNSYKNLAK